MFKVGDKIVYPMHGAGTIESIEEREILGEKQKYYMPSSKINRCKRCNRWRCGRKCIRRS